jgi:hypothetical protein
VVRRSCAVAHTCSPLGGNIQCTCGAHAMHTRRACATCAAARALHVPNPPSGAPERPHGLPLGLGLTAACRCLPSAATH